MAGRQAGCNKTPLPLESMIFQRNSREHSSAGRGHRPGDAVHAGLDERELRADAAGEALAVEGDDPDRDGEAGEEAERARAEEQRHLGC